MQGIVTTNENARCSPFRAWDPGGWRSGAGLPMVYEHDSSAMSNVPCRCPPLALARGLGEELVAPRGIPGTPHLSVFPTSKVD